MAINLSDMTFDAELEPNTEYAFRITSVNVVANKSNPNKIRLNVGAAVAEGPAVGTQVYFAGFDFLIVDKDNPSKQQLLFKNFILSLAKLTGEDPKYLAGLGVPTEADEQTELTQFLENKCFLAEPQYQEARGGYDGRWQLTMRGVRGPIDEDDIEAPDFSALLED